MRYEIGRVYKVYSKWLDPVYIFITRIEEDRKKYRDIKIIYNNIQQIGRERYFYVEELRRYDVELVS